jgi:phospholipase/carboxylesterase
MSASPALPHELRPARGEPEGALVLLHGRGTDELDLLPLIDELDPDGRLVGITPRGPLSLPPGGAHWYVVERVGFPHASSFRQSYELLAGWLEGLPGTTGVPWSRTVMGGFSQGAVMSYALGLGAGRPSPAGILALSGFIPTVPGFEVELEGRAGLPVAIGHGTFDPVIGVEFGRSARERLEAAGLSVTYREYRLPHAVDPRFLAELRPWLIAAVAGGASGRARPGEGGGA